MSDYPPKSEVDWFIFVAGSLLLVAVILPIVFVPDASRELIANIFTFLTTEMGVVYIIAATLIFVFLLAVALSGWGSIRLGDQPPQYSSASWIAMLFSCGIGASLIYWGAAEWVFYYLDPPFGIEAKSDEAILWAMSYGMFHWGPVGWALYCLPAIALAAVIISRKFLHSGSAMPANRYLVHTRTEYQVVSLICFLSLAF